MREESPWYQLTEMSVFVRLQRPLPVARIFRPGSDSFSTSTTSMRGHSRFRVMAAARPDAPAPMMSVLKSIPPFCFFSDLRKYTCF